MKKKQQQKLNRQMRRITNHIFFIQYFETTSEFAALFRIFQIIRHTNEAQHRHARQRAEFSTTQCIALHQWPIFRHIIIDTYKYNVISVA